MKRPRPAQINIPDDAKEVFSGVRYKIYQWDQKQFDGSYATYEIAKRNDTVIIIPVIGNEVVIVKEKQPHWKEAALALVAGGVEDEEELTIAARRELEEETGMVFKDFYLVSIDQAVSGAEWFLYTFIAKNLLETKEKSLDTGEQNEVMKITVDNLIEMTKTRKLFHRPRLIESYIIQDKLEEFRDLLQNPKKYQIEY